ncbi:MAG: hypothetical protein ACRDH7_14965 [Actinomycetota bacterium]
MTTVAGRAPAPDALHAEWVAWAAGRVDPLAPGVEPPPDPTTDDDQVIVLEEATGTADRIDGRLCAEPGCITRLSKYNIASRCFAHDRGPL